MRAAFYKGTRPGLAGIYNRLVRWWTRSEFSHVELVLSTGDAWSASFADGGVRNKPIDVDTANWVVIDLPAGLEQSAEAWFRAHRGAKYDLLGNLQFVLAPIPHSKSSWFCSEAVAAALGIPDPWRYAPGTLASALTLLSPGAPDTDHDRLAA
ncbi:hypothetical protein [Massilia timonae]|uniref:hypothetical protein n=1 Tax=Massilia timonae TaxID=47229 RepID=UPI00289B9379|nr:hypothetical protein [Massilia timonae]